MSLVYKWHANRVAREDGSDLSDIDHEVNVRYEELTEDVLFAFMLFYSNFLSDRVRETLEGSNNNFALVLLAVVLLFEFFIGLQIRESLELTHSRFYHSIAEWYGFVSNTFTLFIVRIALDYLKDWAEVKAAVQSGSLAQEKFYTIIYLSYAILIFLALAYSKIAEKTHGPSQDHNHSERHGRLVLRHIHKFVDRVVFGTTLFFVQIILPKDKVLHDGLFLVVLFITVIIAKVYDSDYMTHTLSQNRYIVDNKLFASVIRVLVLLLSRSVINAIRNYVGVHMIPPSRITTPIILLFVFASFAQTSGDRDSPLSKRSRKLLGDILYGLNVFVAEFFVDELVDHIPQALRLVTFVLFVVAITLVISWEVFIERQVYEFAHSIGDTSFFKVLHRWIDISNRLVIFILIQLVLETLHPMFDPNGPFDGFWQVVVPLILTFAGFVFIPGFGTTYDDTKEDEAKKVKQESKHAHHELEHKHHVDAQ